MREKPSDPFAERLSLLLPKGDVADTRSPLVLAYVGDAVFELAVRTYLATHSDAHVRELHKKAADQVRASAQARDLAEIEELLTEAERDIVRRARNTKVNVPKSATLYEYRYSTAFEALIGHLFLSGDLERLIYILEFVIAKGESNR